MRPLCCLCLLFILPGCATVKSLNANVPLDRKIFVYSGTRLDWNALRHDEVSLRQFNTDPPSYPLLDLPLSFTADTALLPRAFIVDILN